QCVSGTRVVQFDRRQRRRIDAAAVREKFGVPPESIPDYLALVGDSADGYPGIPGWGAKTAATLLARFGHIEAIPENARKWNVQVRAADRLAKTLSEQRELALLFKRLATLVTDGPVHNKVDDLKWSGPGTGFAKICERLENPGLLKRAKDLAGRI
ncbi:MAG TPA: 5'-3' exonuclease H3TH domain-containing protein, partial [Acidobacteriota bacterium]|nr:5'-3' exonuclease H3TH domain-containing protein [Acidobacteriota bacterium]